MKKFILHGDMAKKFAKEVDLDVGTIREAINGFCSNFPSFRRYIVNKSLKGINYNFIDENKHTYENFCGDIKLKGSVFHIVPQAEGRAAGIMPFLGNMALGFGMQWLMEKLNPVQDDGTPEYEIIETNSFIYSQNENRAAQGTPVPIVYGQIRVGSQIIHSSIENYDYDYDNASIYAVPRTQRDISKITNGKYNFVLPESVTDYRSTTSEAFKGYSISDPFKRAVNYSGPNGSKGFDPSQENESFNENYKSNAGAGGERKVYGPSEGSPRVPGSEATTVGSNNTARPYLFPPAGSLDSNMRPQSSADLCVERESQAGTTVNEAIAFADSSPMIVGGRGSYQKLESIGIYKSLEILSEGPIAGLANPITGFDQDNGYVNFPLGASDAPVAGNTAKLESLKYSATKDHLETVSNSNDTITVNAGGSNYSATNGTHDILCDGDSSAGNITIRAKKPKSTTSATIGDIIFEDNIKTFYEDNVLTNNLKLVSANRLFLLNINDGAILPNENTTNTITGFLDAKYSTTENIGATNRNVFLVDKLAEDSQLLGSDFNVGKGYGSSTITHTIEPDSERMQYSLDIKKNTYFDRSIQAKTLDHGLFLLDSLTSQNMQDLVDIYENDNTATIPNTTIGWDNMCRIQLDHANNTILNNRNILRTINIGRYSIGGFLAFTVTMSVTVSLGDYYSLGRVSRSGNYSPSNPTYFYTAPYTEGANNRDRFDDLARGTPQNIGTLMKADPDFATAVYNAFSNVMGGHNATTLNNGARYFRFLPGSGNSTNGSQKLNGLPVYMMQGGFNDLSSVTITSPGTNPDDDSADPRGFYSPFLFPRVTVFVIRKNTFGVSGLIQFMLMPTRFDAVARVDAQGNVVEVHLLSSPDRPVWDTMINVFTDVLPQDIAAPRPTSFGTDTTSATYNYQDIGFYLKIDKSTDHQTLKFDITDGGAVSNNFATNAAKRRELHNMWPSWSDHVEQTLPSRFSAYGAGIMPDVATGGIGAPTAAAKFFSLDEVNQEVSDPTTPAAFTLNLETIDISTSRSTTLRNAALGTNVSRICTGRPISLTLTNAGAGYAKKNGELGPGLQISKSVYNETYGIHGMNTSSANSQTANKGYRPNQTFYIYGVSRFVMDGSLPSANAVGLRAHFFNFKAKVITNDRGSIQTISVIDKGTHFAEGFGDQALRLHHIDANGFRVYSNDAGSPDFIPNLNVLTNISALFNTNNAAAQAANQARFFNPDNHYPKSPLILESTSNHLSGGSINKFYIKESGSGFNSSQSIFNPYDVVTFKPPTVRITVLNGSITGAVLLRTAGNEISGYSASDNNITLSVSPGVPTNAPIANNPNSDDYAWARSIFLNDVPIRDNNNRFNYSKFHFDLRIGHHKNGIRESHIDKSRLAASTVSHIISDEFKIPVYTKFIDYPLYGPRNENEKDYYYAHTIKNPEVTDVCISIKINELHYVYEGDEAAIYINLIPILIAAIGYTVGTSVIKGIIARAATPDPVVSAGNGIGYAGPCGGPVSSAVSNVGTVTPGKPSAFTELAAQAAEMLLILAGGIIGIILGLMIAKAIPCKWLPFLCFKVGEIIKNSGEIWPAKMRLAIEYGLEGEALKTDTIVFRGCATNPYVKDVYIHNLPEAKIVAGSTDVKKNRILRVYRTTRELDPVTGGIIEARYKISSDLVSITEYVGGFFSYPNSAIIGTRVNSKDHPDVPNREYLLKGRLIKIPSNYFPEQPFDPNSKDDFTKQEILELRYSGDWDGTFKQNNGEDQLEWTSNPAWIIYDLLINDRYGMGKYGIKESDIDKWSFYDFAKRCDEEVDVVVEGKQTTERRHMCNLYIDAERQAYDYIRELMNIYNANINFSAGKIYISQDAPVGDSGAIMLFNNSNISEEGFSYSTTPQTNRITAATVDYLDERDNYMQKSEYVEDAQGIKEHGYSHIKIAGIGVTRRGEAHRIAWQKILTRQLEKEIIQFKTGLHASYLRIGDVFEVLDNNKMSKHSGGRISRVVGARVIELDIPVAAISNASALYIQKFAESDEIDDTTDSSETSDRRSAQFEEYTISSRSGFNITLSSDLNADIKQGSVWMIKENDTDKIKPKKYKVKNIKELSNLNYEILAVEHLEEKYEQIDNSTGSTSGINLEEREYYGPVIIVP